MLSTKLPPKKKKTTYINTCSRPTGLCPGGAAFSATILATEGDCVVSYFAFHAAEAANASRTPRERKNTWARARGSWNADGIMDGLYFDVLGHIRTMGAVRAPIAAAVMVRVVRGAGVEWGL